MKSCYKNPFACKSDYLYEMTVFHKVFQRDEWNCRFEPDAQLVQNVVSAALVRSGSRACATKI
jgi:hypothetical protein